MRIGLKALFGLIALSAIALGLWVLFVVRPYQEQLRAIRRLQDLGARVGISSMSSRNASPLLRIAGQKYFPHVTSIHFPDHGIGDKELTLIE